MRILIGAVFVLAAAFVAWVTLSTRAAPEAPTMPAAPASSTRAPDAPLAQAAELEAKVDRLSAEIGRLQSELALLRSDAREPVADSVPIAAAPAAPGQPTPLWYLEQYERSFDGGGAGSEYFRLAVEAYAPELVEPIAQRLRDLARPWLLREKLAGCLGTPRLARHGRAIDALLGAARSATEQSVVTAALHALAMIGDADAGRALERLVWHFPWPPTRNQAIDVIVALADAQANLAVLRLMRSAPDDAALIALVARLDAGEVVDSLEAFGFASRESQPVRLAAAHRIGDFRSPEFTAFVDQWASVERDPEVLEALGRARDEQREIRNWSAAQVVGPPDANASRDDPKAWASRQGDMGEQWLDVFYAPPLRAELVRIFEVNAPGAVTAVIGYDESGREHRLWAGDDPTETPGAFEVAIPATKFRVARVRIVLDTDRTPGWNEIDAVELVGPDGRAWAARAVASSEYGR